MGTDELDKSENKNETGNAILPRKQTFTENGGREGRITKEGEEKYAPKSGEGGGGGGGGGG